MQRHGSVEPRCRFGRGPARGAGATLQLSVLFLFYSPAMEQGFKIMWVEGGRDELVASAGNFLVARAAFDTAAALWPEAAIELRQGARVVLKSGAEHSAT